MTNKIIIHYIFDPLCGWCYGASATVAELATHPDVDIRPMASGLFAGHGARPMAGFAAQAWQNDLRIEKLSGRTFSQAYRQQVLGAKDAMLDSSIATLALTALLQEAPAREIEVLKAIQEARYVDGKDVTSPGVVAALLMELNLPQTAELLANPDDGLLQAVETRVAAAQQLMAEFGLRGVPAMILGDEPDRRPIDASALYAGPDHILAALGHA